MRNPRSRLNYEPAFDSPERIEEAMKTQRQKTGFTLLELLVVVAIIAIIAALSANALFRVRTAQQEKLTGDKIVQLQKAFLQQWTAALDNARKEPIPDIVKAYALQDPDRAKAIWAYLHLRKNFPQSSDEAQALPPAPLPATNPPGIYLGGVMVLQRNEKIWNVVQGSNTLSADEQAAVCAYAFMTTAGLRGMETGIGDTMTKKVGTATQFNVFNDTFNMPITFRRFFYTAEMDNKPYIAKNVTTNKDPLDPFGKLPALFLPASTLTPAQQTDLLRAIGGNRTLNNTNFMPTFISSGINRTFDPLLPTNLAQALVYNPNGDDIYGYRLNVEGLTGN